MDGWMSEWMCVWGGCCTASFTLCAINRTKQKGHGHREQLLEAGADD